MKRFALAATLLAAIGLSVGCGGADTSSTTEPVEPPPVESGDDAAAGDTADEGATE